MSNPVAIRVDSTPMRAVITNSGIQLPVYESKYQFATDVAHIVASDNNVNWAIGRLLVMMDKGMPDHQLVSMGIRRDEWDNFWDEVCAELLTDGAELKPKWINAKWVCKTIPEELVVPWTTLPYSYYLVLAKVMKHDPNSFEAWLEYAVEHYAKRKEVPFSVAEFRKLVNASLKAIESEVKDNEDGDDDEDDEEEKPTTVAVSIPKRVKDEITMLAEDMGMTTSKWIAMLIEEELEKPNFNHAK